MAGIIAVVLPRVTHESDQQADEEIRWAAWMTKVQAGDQAAYEKLLAELMLVIRAFVIARFGRSVLAEDMVQECLLAIHHGRHSYDSKRAFRPWMFAIVRHKCIDVLRQGQAYSRALNDFVTEANTMSQESQEDAADGESLLDGLSNAHREALILTKIKGLSVAEAASCLGVSVTVLKVRVFRAVRAARKILEATS